MNDNLAAVVKKYSVHGHEEYAQLMHGYSKDTLIGMFTDLLFGEGDDAFLAW